MELLQIEFPPSKGGYIFWQINFFSISIALPSLELIIKFKEKLIIIFCLLDSLEIGCNILKAKGFLNFSFSISSAILLYFSFQPISISKCKLDLLLLNKLFQSFSLNFQVHPIFIFFSCFI